MARDRFLGVCHPIGCAGDDDTPPCAACARSHIHHVIGGAQQIEIVFDDEHGVAQIAQLAQHVDQPGGVARMQADRRFVEHVQHAGQGRAQQRSESQPMRFTGRKGGRRAIECQITDADVDQAPHARLQIVHDRFGDDPFLGGHHRSELIDPRGQIVQRQLGHIDDRATCNRDAAAFGIEPRAVAIGTGRLSHEISQFLAIFRIVCLIGVAAQEVRHDALEVAACHGRRRFDVRKVSLELSAVHAIE